MPLLFKQRNHTRHHHPSYGHFPLSSSNAGQPPGSTINNEEVSVNTGSFPRTLSIHQKRFRSAVASFSSERTGNLIHRYGWELSKLVRNPKLLLPLFKKYYRKWHLKHLIPLTFVLLYMVIGAVIFLWLEESNENTRILKRNDKIKRERNLFVKRVDEIFGDQAAINKIVTRRKFIEEALDHFHSQLKIDIYHDINDPEWSLTTAMYYSGTIFTTIGYGDVTCSTVAGRILTVIYAIVGIPIMLITLNHLGKFLYKWINEIVLLFTTIIDKIKQKFWPSNNKKLSKDAGKSILSQQSTIDRHIFPSPGSELNGSYFEKDKITDVKSIDSNRRVSFALEHEDEEDEELPLNMHVMNDSDQNKTTFSVTPPPSTVSFLVQNLALEKTKEGTLDTIDAELGNEEILTNADYINDDEFEQTNLHDETSMPRMPVSVALTCTLGWIFICAGLFKLWEDEWTYAESCYFMFISADTRRAVMQKVQEDAKETGLQIPAIFENIDEKTGMPKILAAADSTKDFENQSAIVDQLVRQSEAMSLLQNSSFIIPPTKSASFIAPLEKICYENDTQTDQIFCEDKNPETNRVEFDDLAIQTESSFEEYRRSAKVSIASLAVQTSAGDSETETADEGVQTVSIFDFSETKETQTIHIVHNENETMTDATSIVETNDEETMTIITPLISLDIQTEQIFTMDEQLQTHLYELSNTDMQTEQPETNNEFIQTIAMELLESFAQTDDLQDPRKAKNISKIRQARRRLQYALYSRGAGTRRVSHGDHPMLNNWRDSINEQAEGDEGETDESDKIGEDDREDIASSYESLNWDPIDGLHAEKQRPVKDLKKMFDKESRNRNVQQTAMGSGFSVGKGKKKE